MLLKKLKESPEKMVSFGLSLICIGLLLIVLGVLWPKLPFLANLWPAWNDFMRGFVFGFAITLEIAGVAINATAAANKRKPL
jgi:hypothetical protein